LKKWTKNREVDNGKSWIADYKEIKDNNYNLSANQYKSATSLEWTYEEPLIILDEILKLENEIITSAIRHLQSTIPLKG
jgi:hypothetical protein